MEEKEFLPFLIKVRTGMWNCLGVSKITFVQEEKSAHHFHVWLFPWHEWMKEIGDGINSIKKIMEYARDTMKNEENLKKIEEDIIKIKFHLNKY